MKKLIALMMVITMILGATTMTNVFADVEEEPLAIDNHLVFDLDLSEYGTTADDSKGLKNSAASGDQSAEFTNVQSVEVGKLDLGGEKPLYYLDTDRSGAAVEFVNEKVNSSSKLTIEAWVYPNSLPTTSKHMFLYGKHDSDTSGKWMLQVVGDANTWRLHSTKYVGNANKIESGLSVGEWHHVVYVLDIGKSTDEKSKLTTYIDGNPYQILELSTEEAFDSEATENVPFRISGGGWHNDNNYMYFNGRYGDVKIYDDVITADEVEKKYEEELPDYTEVREDIKLVFDLDFENYDVNDTTTHKGLKNSAAGDDLSSEFTSVVGMVMGEERVNGQMVKYLDATETDDGIDVVNDAINNSPDITVEAWVKNDSVKGHMFLYGNKTDEKWQFQVGRSSDKEWVAATKGTTDTRVPFESDTPKWRHLVITLDRSDKVNTRTITVYVDGERIGRPITADSGSMYSPNADGENPPFRISGGSYGEQGCDTKFADVKLYTGVMTEAEAMEHYIADQYKYTEKKMVFDLGFSEDDSIVNKVEGNTSTITLNGSPKVVTDTNNSNIKYLQPVSPNEGAVGTYNGSIKVQDDTIMGNGEITIESWMRWDPSRNPISYYNGHLAMLTKGVKGEHSLQLYDTDSNNFSAALLSDTSKAVSMDTKNEWIHYVATREYNVANKEVTMTIYVNGEKLEDTTKTIEDAFTSNMDKKGKNYWLDIGSYSSAASTCAFNGDIGTFKVYNYALTQDETYAKYLADTIDGKCVCNPDFLNGAGEKIDNLTSETDKVTAKYKIYNFTVDSVNPRIAVLGYYENNVLQKVVIDTTTEFGTIESGATSTEYSITIEGIEPTEGSYVKLFVWDGFDNIARIVGVNEGDMKLTYTELPAID